jgi:hypothetical protein
LSPSAREEVEVLVDENGIHEKTPVKQTTK